MAKTQAIRDELPEVVVVSPRVGRGDVVMRTLWFQAKAPGAQADEHVEGDTEVTRVTWGWVVANPKTGWMNIQIYGRYM